MGRAARAKREAAAARVEIPPMTGREIAVIKLMRAYEDKVEADRHLAAVVRQARAARVSWAQIGRMTDMSEEGARKRWGSRD